mmetsp:Transcript_17012/g.42924  ORF Transcript_17012/g.42924 Transcript_17012/m.42924 type:complete len:102 (-) Transcript_17012:157-462(-)
MKRSLEPFEDARDAKRFMLAHAQQHAAASANYAESFAMGDGMVLCCPPMAQPQWCDGMEASSSDDERDAAGENFRHHALWWSLYEAQVASGAIVMEQGFGI